MLSQPQEDGQNHPVAYASRALSPQETNYSITEPVTLAVVWATTYFHAYLYGHSVTVYTDHTAVKAFLEDRPGEQVCVGLSELYYEIANGLSYP